MGISSSNSTKSKPSTATPPHNDHQDRMIGMEPQWPHSVPSRHATLIFSVLCGNSRLHWAFHGNQQEEYHPKLFWRTEPPNPDDENEHLASFIPHEILQEIYGKTATSADAATGAATSPISATAAVSEEGTSSGSGGPLASLTTTTTAAPRAWTAAQAIQHRTNQRVPTIYVYLMDSNHQHAQALTDLLIKKEDQRNRIPAVVYRLRQDDFNSLLLASSSTAAYAGMGIDRIANIVAAQYLAPLASAHLVIDGGTATTYTASYMPSSTITKRPTTLCGGIGAGLRLKFRSLYDYTWNLPLIQYEHVLKIMQQAETNQAPLKILEPAILSTTATATASAEASRDDTTTTNGPMDATTTPPKPPPPAAAAAITTSMKAKEDADDLVRKSIVASVLTETTLLLCNVIRNWCSEIHENTTNISNGEQGNGEQTLPTIFITGGDGEIMEKLLRPNHSHIVKTNPVNAQLLQTAHWTSNEVDDDKADKTHSASPLDTAQFRIQKNTKLTHFAVQALLLSHSGFSSETKSQPDAEWQRELIGHRVAIQQSSDKTTKPPVRYGSILYAFLPSSNERKKADDVCFYVFYDDDDVDDDNDSNRNVEHRHLSLEQIYDALKLYVQSDEKAKIADEYRKMKMAIKEKDAQEMITVLEKKSAVIQKLLASRAAELAKTTQRAVATGKRPAESTEVDPTKKAKTATSTTTTTNVAKTQSMDTPSTSEPSSDPFIGRRMCKFFSKDLFFGTIYDCYEDDDYTRNWGVFYEDGDKEDMEWKAINKALVLYEKHKAKDAKRGWTPEQLLADVKEKMAQEIDDQEDD